MIVNSYAFRHFYNQFQWKTPAKLVYLQWTLVKASSAFRWAIWAFFEGYTSLSKSMLRAITYIRNILYSGSRAIAANFFFLISSTCLVAKSMSPVMYDLYYKFWAWKSTLILLIFKKDISSTTSQLTSANKKLFLKNLSLLSLFNIEKVETIIL